VSELYPMMVGGHVILPSVGERSRGSQAHLLSPETLVERQALAVRSTTASLGAGRLQRPKGIALTLSVPRVRTTEGVGIGAGLDIGGQVGWLPALDEVLAPS